MLSLCLILDIGQLTWNFREKGGLSFRLLFRVRLLLQDIAEFLDVVLELSKLRGRLLSCLTVRRYQLKDFITFRERSQVLKLALDVGNVLLDGLH
jgi:hypothetical protein